MDFLFCTRSLPPKLANISNIDFYFLWLKVSISYVYAYNLYIKAFSNKARAAGSRLQKCSLLSFPPQSMLAPSVRCCIAIPTSASDKETKIQWTVNVKCMHIYKYSFFPLHNKIVERDWKKKMKTIYKVQALPQCKLVTWKNKLPSYNDTDGHVI